MKRLCVLTPWWPSRINSFSDLFVYDQVRSIAGNFSSVDVYYVAPYYRISRTNIISSNRASFEIDNTSLPNNATASIIKYFPFPKNSRLLPWSIAKSIKYLLRMSNYDIILSQTVFPIGLAAQIAYPNHIHYVVTHGTDFRYFSAQSHLQPQIHHALRCARKIICVSEGLRDDVAQFCNEAQTRVIHNGIDFQKIPFDSTKDYPPFHNEEDFSFIFVGALIHQKGVYDLLKAFRLFNRSGVRASLKIVGSGIELEGMKNFCIDEGLDNVYFYGQKSNNSTLTLMHSSHCLILPSHKEAFGRVLLEMMAFGNPCIATKAGGPEYIIDDSVGALCEPANPIALCHAMADVYNNYARFKKDVVRAYVEKKFSLASKGIELAQELLND